MLGFRHGAAVALAALVGCFGEATFTQSRERAVGSTDCSQDVECGPAGECTKAVCSVGVCLESFVPAGTPATDQVTGDCSIAVCDGKGAVLLQTDGADVVDDGNPCTLEGCSNEGPLAAQAPMGSVCGVKACCDPRGACITGSCTSDEQCPIPPDSFCAQAICNECGQCDLELAPQGSTSMADVAGDCTTLVCDGTGDVFTKPDDTDVPGDDMDPCTVETCEDGMPTTKVVECPYPQTCYMGVCG